MNSARRPDPSASNHTALEKAAADWIARLDRGLTPEEAAQFAAWEAADPRHSVELARGNTAWRLLDTADEVPEIMQLAQEMEARQTRRAAVRRWRAWAFAGAGLAAMLAVTWTLSSRSSASFETSPEKASLTATARSYQVVPSTAQRLTLADGSLVELRADSAVETAFSPEERRVRIVRGEAHFAVVKDATRPFIVQAGEVSVRAVGTAFNVRLAPATIEVLVTEGKVRVDDTAKNQSLLSLADPSDHPAASVGPSSSAAPPVLTAGQRVVISATAPSAVPPLAATADDTERALAWRSVQLVFERTSLAEAVAAFNSFNRCQLVLGDPALRTRKLGGTFRADNIDAFVRLLETGFELTAERRSEFAIVLHGAASGQNPE